LARTSFKVTEWQPVTRAPDELGESPFWHPQEGRLYWVDIPGRQLRRLDPASGDVQSWPMPLEPGCIAPLRSGGLVIALRDGVYRANRWGAELELLAPAQHDPKTTRFNDGKADPHGRFWAGTMYEPRDARKAQLFSFELQHGAGPMVEVKAGDAITANGLAWSPDSRTLYWSDTPHHVIYAWDWDAPTNAMSGQRVFRQFEPKPAGWKAGDPGYGGRPDGAAVDVEGNYWCAMFEGGRLLKLSPSGETLAEIPVPLRCPTMPCFGGADLKTLYLTSGRHNRPAQELEALPHSGHVIATRVEVPGLPVNFVSD
jgi:sugar lactone lactonase YvrE